jgi:hypothetical protein
MSRSLIITCVITRRQKFEFVLKTDSLFQQLCCPTRQLSGKEYSKPGDECGHKATNNPVLWTHSQRLITPLTTCTSATLQSRPQLPSPSPRRRDPFVEGKPRLRLETYLSPNPNPILLEASGSFPRHGPVGHGPPPPARAGAPRAHPLRLALASSTTAVQRYDSVALARVSDETVEWSRRGGGGCWARRD